MKIRAGAWIIVYYPKKNSFLLAKRSRRVKNPNRWNLFGGVVETFRQTRKIYSRELNTWKKNSSCAKAPSIP